MNQVIIVKINVGRDAYLSTPRFVKYLTDLSSDLLMLDNKKEILCEELSKLNQKLPSNVYIPFVNSQIRSYVVLNIPPNESKIFVTKDKVPYLIAAEIFDPLEIAYNPIIGTLLGKPIPAKLPAPKSPERSKQKKISAKKMLVTPEEAQQKELEVLLNLHFNPKSQDKTHKTNPAITINQTKSQHAICGSFIHD